MKIVSNNYSPYTTTYKYQQKPLACNIYNSNSMSFKSSEIINTGLKKISSQHNLPISISEVKSLVSDFSADKLFYEDIYNRIIKLQSNLCISKEIQCRSKFFTGDDLNPRNAMFIRKFKNFSKDEKLKLTTDFANLNNGKYLNFWRSNPDKLSMYVNHNDSYLLYRLNHFNNETWDAILKSYIAFFNLDNNKMVKLLSAVLKYQRDYYCRQINAYLDKHNRSYDNKNNLDINEIEEIIEDLKQASIASTSEDKNIPLWRDDDVKIFDSYDIEGEKLDKLISEATRGDSVQAEKVLNYFNKTQPAIHRKAFLSTAIKPFEFMKKPIKWHLSLDEGVNYLYISDIINTIKAGATESELLIHSCTLKINSAEIKNHKLILYATIKPLEVSE